MKNGDITMKNAMRLQSKLNQTVIINGYKPFNFDIERVYSHSNGTISGSLKNHKVANGRVHLTQDSTGLWREDVPKNKGISYHLKRA
jgi:hypothetical protein